MGLWRMKSTTALIVIGLNLLLATELLARGHKFGWQRSSTNVNEIENSLFSHLRDPFGDEDKWAAFVDEHREAWTSANEVVQLTDGMQEILKSTKSIREKGVTVPVDIQIVVSTKYLTKEKKDLIAHYANAMQAGQNGTSLIFKVSIASEVLFKRISMHEATQDPADFMGILEQTATSLGALNVLYIIVNHQDEPVNEYKARTPFVGRGRVSWILYDIDKEKELNVASLLYAAERAAERVYAPSALFFPIPFIRHLRVELAAYTPGHGHRALWLQNFAWDEFERSVRSVAIRGQTVSFFSFQANSECHRCERAFHDVDKYDRDFPKRASIILNNDVLPNRTWAEGQLATHSKRRVPENTMRIYVLDTVKLRKNEVVQRLERHPVAVFPGLGIITLRSSNHEAVRSLEYLLIKAVVAGAYGISEPDLYMNPKLTRALSSHARHPSAVLHDVAIRLLVRSVVEKRLAELEEIVEGILYFDIDPAKSLGDHEYAYMAQRVNLILFKLQRAQVVLGESNDAETALYLVSSTRHDMKAIRTAFGLSEGTKSFERFRDPTLRCHFSRLRREALKASQILESSYPTFRSILIAATSFTTAASLTYFLLARLSIRKLRGKRE